MILHIKERLESCLFVFPVLRYAFYFLIESFKDRKHLKTPVRDEAFARWHEELGHHFKEHESATAVPRLLAACSGVVLELGPATGNQLSRFSPEKVTHIYGVEPNKAFVAPLQSRLAQTPQLQAKYTFVSCGVEKLDILAQHGITESSVDSVASIQVLCSVDNPEDAARAIWKLLKPGGELVFWEHHRSDDLFTRLLQRLLNGVWSFAIGNCSLCRPTRDIILESGNWEIIELQEGEQPWELLPRAWGRLRKIA